MRQWSYNSVILYLDTIWRRVVSYTSRPLYSRGKRAPNIYWIGGCVSPRDGVWTLWGKGNLLPAVQPTVQ
jgi:hypothetical protein